MPPGLFKRISAASREEWTARFRESWAVSWPMILIMFFEFLINLTDVYIAGRLGKEYQAAVGFVSQIYFVFIVIANALVVGTVSVVSRLHTSGDRESLSDTVHTVVLTSFVSGLVLGIMGTVLSESVLAHLNIPREVKVIGAPLIEIYAGGLLFHYLLINTNGILRSTGGIRQSLGTMAFVCLANVGLNFLLVFYTPLGFRGIALSTALSVLAGSLLNLFFLRGLFGPARSFSREGFRRVFSIGWPSGLLGIIWQTGSTLLFLILSSLPRNRVEVIAAFTNGLRIESAIFLPAFALNMSNAVVVGNLMGASRREDAYRGGLITALTGVVIISALTLAVVLNARSLISLLTGHSGVIDEGVRYLCISMISEPFMAWAVILGGALNGAGDTRGVMIIVALSQWLVRLPLAWFLGIYSGWGPAAVWWSMNASILLHAFFITLRYRKRDWLRKSP